MSPAILYFVFFLFFSFLCVKISNKTQAHCATTISTSRITSMCAHVCLSVTVRVSDRVRVFRSVRQRLVGKAEWWLIDMFFPPGIICLQQRPWCYGHCRNSVSVQFGSAHRPIGSSVDLRDDSAQILFQPFLQEALVSRSGLGRDVHSF